MLRLAREGYAPTPAPSPRSSSGSATTTINGSNTGTSANISSYGHSTSSSSSSYSDCLSAARYPSRHVATSVVVNSRGARSRDNKDKDASFLNKALKYPICNLDTLLILESMCLKSLHERTQCRFQEQQLVKMAKVKLNHNGGGSVGHGHGLGRGHTGIHTATSSTSIREEIDKVKNEKPPPFPKFLPVPPRCIDIPKRLFRNLPSSSSSSSFPPPPSSLSTPTHTSPISPEIASSSSTTTTTTTTSSPTSNSTFETEDLPLLTHLIIQLHANPNSSRGYPLAKAVLARHIPLIQILLQNGADPSTKDHMAIMLAIGRRDLELVRLLIERYDDDEDKYNSWAQAFHGTGMKGDSMTVNSSGINKKRKRNDGGGRGGKMTSPPKKRKLEDRCRVTSDMLELAVKQGSEDLIQYFMSKGEQACF